MLSHPFICFFKISYFLYPYTLRYLQALGYTIEECIKVSKSVFSAYLVLLSIFILNKPQSNCNSGQVGGSALLGFYWQCAPTLAALFCTFLV